MPDDIRFQIEFTADEISTLANAVEFYYKMWPGSPAAPAEEQEMLWHLRKVFQCLLLEVSYQRPSR